MRVRAVGLGFSPQPTAQTVACRSSQRRSAAHLLNSLACGTHREPFPPEGNWKGTEPLSCRTLSLGRLTSMLPSLDMKTAR